MQKIIAIDHDRCTGCHSCEMACSAVHEGKCSLHLSRIAILKTAGGGTKENIPIVCNQCHDPVCADVCVMGGISRDADTGALIVNEGLCVGCRTCVAACPFGGVIYHSLKGCAMKCDLCGGDPICVKVCAYTALEYLCVDEWGRRQRLKGADNISRIYAINRK